MRQLIHKPWELLKKLSNFLAFLAAFFANLSGTKISASGTKKASKPRLKNSQAFPRSSSGIAIFKRFVVRIGIFKRKLNRLGNERVELFQKLKTKVRLRHFFSKKFFLTSYSQKNVKKFSKFPLAKNFKSFLPKKSHVLSAFRAVEKFFQKFVPELPHSIHKLFAEFLCNDSKFRIFRRKNFFLCAENFRGNDVFRKKIQRSRGVFTQNFSAKI